MGLKRRNPARTRLFTAPQVLAALAPPPAPASPRPEPTAEATPAPGAPLITGEQRHRMIARAAYGRAERAGFKVDPFQSWLAAEREIDAELARLARSAA